MTDEAHQQALADREAIEAEAEAAARQARADAIAAHQSHPHAQLRGVLKDLHAPGNIDINARIGVLQGAVTRLTQIVLEHTPAGPLHPDDPSFTKGAADGEK